MLLILVPIAFFAAVTTVVLGLAWLSHRGRLAALRTIGEVTASGQALDSALIERLMPPRRAAVGKWFAIGCLLLAAPTLGVGAGLLTAGSFFASGATAAGLLVGGTMNLS